MEGQRNRRISRRRFLWGTVGTGAVALAQACARKVVAVPGETVARSGGVPPSEKIRVACIGMGGQMGSLVRQMAGLSVTVVAVCDVDDQRIETLRGSLEGEGCSILSDAKSYRDYRKLLDSEKAVDAVVIGTPDHWHAALCTASIQAGKHVYCEKPLTHTVAEARALRELSRQSKVITQTGNQGSASGNLRRSIELIQAGVIGQVEDVHLWHPAHGWPCGVDRPPGADPVPNDFDWDFWIGPAPWRPFKEKVYHPGTWRGWYDFGGGSLADFCCHGFNLPVRALKLDYPTKIEIAGQGLHKESFITSGTIRFYFPARGNRGPVTLHFHTGGEMPGNDILEGLSETFGKVSETGCLLLGKKGTLSVGLWNSDCYLRMKGEPEFKGGLKHEAARSVSQTLPRTVSHVLEWVEACRKGSLTFSDFDIGGHITEIGLAGVVALRLGHDIDWDGEKMEVRGLPDAAALIKPEYREGFTL